MRKIYHGQSEAHERVHLTEKVTKNPRSGKTGNDVEPQIWIRKLSFENGMFQHNHLYWMSSFYLRIAEDGYS